MKKNRSSVSEELIYALLKKYFGFDHFKDFQFAVIKQLLSGNDVLGILGTGAGKSLCYQLPALYWAESGKTTIVIEPIISLMEDQCNHLNHYLRHVGSSVKSIAINSQTSAEDLRDFKENRSHYKIIYVSPERFTDTLFLQNPSLRDEVSLIVVDEAHCISLWGHDFRISYSKISSTMNTFFRKRPVVAAFTATATQHVTDDILRLLEIKRNEEQTNVFLGNMMRDNLNLLTYDTPYLLKQQNTTDITTAKFTFIENYVKEHSKELGIIYCNTRFEVDLLDHYLSKKRIKCSKYYGSSDPSFLEDTDSDTIKQQNINTLQKFFDDSKKLSCVIATSAFGMGIDKPSGRDVTYIIHFDLPRSVENFYQEVGRAGRHTVTASDCILLYDPGDASRLRKQIDCNPDYTRTCSEYKLAVDRLEKMTEYAGLTSAEERNCYIENYFKNYIPSIDQINPSQSIYLNRSWYGWQLLSPDSLVDPDKPDFFDIMVMDALNSHFIFSSSPITYLEILRMLSGKKYIDSKSPVKINIKESIEKCKHMEIDFSYNGFSNMRRLLPKNTFKISPLKNGEALTYNIADPSFYFDRKNTYYRMPSDFLGLPNDTQIAKFADKQEKLLPMPQTKEGLMIKYYLLSKITYQRHLHMRTVTDTNSKRIMRNDHINLSDMIVSLGISFPDNEKGAIAKKKRIKRYIEDYLKALNDYKYIEKFEFKTTKRTTKNTIFLYGDSICEKYNTVKIFYSSNR